MHVNESDNNADIDEFMSTRLHPERTLSDELKVSFAHADLVMVPWVFYMYNENVAVRHIRSDMLWRWNHSLHHRGGKWKTRDRYHEIEGKPIFRVPKIRRCIKHPHLVVEIKGEGGNSGPRAVDSVWRGPTNKEHMRDQVALPARSNHKIRYKLAVQAKMRINCDCLTSPRSFSKTSTKMV